MKTHITFEVEVTDVAAFIARLGLSGVPAPTIEHGNTDTATETRSRRGRSTTTEVADAPVQETQPANEPRRRRGSSATVPAAEAPPVPEALAEAPPTTEGSTRRRRTSSDAAPAAAPSISDLDLAKGASEAAEALTKLGDKGQEIVQDVLKEDFGVTMVNELPDDKRQAFLDAIQEQVTLAKQDAVKA